MACRRGAAVELVLRVEDEEDVEGAGEARVGAVPRVRPRIQHVQEVLRYRGEEGEGEEG